MPSRGSSIPKTTQADAPRSRRVYVRQAVSSVFFSKIHLHGLRRALVRSIRSRRSLQSARKHALIVIGHAQTHCAMSYWHLALKSRTPAVRAVGGCAHEGFLHMAPDPSDPWLPAHPLPLAWSLMPLSAKLLCLCDRSSGNPWSSSRPMVNASPFGTLQSMGRIRV